MRAADGATFPRGMKMDHGLEHKFCRAEGPAGSLTVAEGSVIEGYASLFGLIDGGGDVVARGAYAGSLKRLGGSGIRVKMLWQHDPAQPIGVWDEVREDERGLWVRGRILRDVARGREAAALIEAGAIDGLSIGYRTLKAVRDDKGRRRLDEVELWEVSLVTFPMLAEARVGAKGRRAPERPHGGAGRPGGGAARRPPDAGVVRRREAGIPDQEGGMRETQGGLREALTEFVGDIKRMHAGIETRMDKQEKTMSLIQAKSAARGRPALSAEPQDAPHRKAFDAYVRSGDDDGLRGLDVEGKSLTTVAADNTGLLVDPQTSETVRGVLTSTASIRRIATVVNVESSSFDVLVDHGSRGFGWSSETVSRTGEDDAQVARIKIPLHELSALPKASQRLLDDAAFDVEGWLASRIAEAFARAEADAFINGDGIDKPKGFLDGQPVREEIWQWGELGYVPTGDATGFSSPDVLIDLVYALDAR